MNQTSRSEASAIALSLYKKLLQKSDVNVRNHLQKQIMYKVDVLRKYKNKLVSFCEKDGSAILWPIIKEMEISIAELNELALELGNPFLLFMVGMGKYGKSTLINALLTSRVAEMDMLPKTWKIDMFVGKENRNEVELIYNDGSKTKHSLESARKLLSTEENKRNESELRIKQEMDRYKDILKTVEQKKEKMKELRKYMLYQSKITEVRWPVTLSKLSRDFRLVDTPGLFQELAGEIKVSLSEYYHKADGVIWLLDANKISAQKSRELMDELNQSLKEIGGKSDNVVAVLNRVDNVRKNGGQEAVEAVCKEADRLFGDIFKVIIPISAKEALEGIESGDQERIAKSGLNELLNIIDETFRKKSQKIQVNSKLRGAQNLQKKLLTLISEYNTKLVCDNDKRLSLSYEFDVSFQNEADSYDSLVNALIEEHTNTVENNISLYTEVLFDIESDYERKEFIKNEIFECDNLGNKIEDMLIGIGKSINKMKNYHISNSYFKEFNYIDIVDLPALYDKKLGIDIPELAMTSFKTTDEAVFSGVGLSIAAGAILGPVGLALVALASFSGLAKWIVVKFKSGTVKRQLSEQLDESMDALYDTLSLQIKNQMDSISNDVKKVREGSFAALHLRAERIDKLIALLDQLNSEIQKPVKSLSPQEMIMGGA